MDNDVVLHCTNSLVHIPKNCFSMDVDRLYSKNAAIKAIHCNSYDLDDWAKSGAIRTVNFRHKDGTTQRLLNADDVEQMAIFRAEIREQRKQEILNRNILDQSERKKKQAAKAEQRKLMAKFRHEFDNDSFIRKEAFFDWSIKEAGSPVDGKRFIRWMMHEGYIVSRADGDFFNSCSNIRTAGYLTDADFVGNIRAIDGRCGPGTTSYLMSVCHGL